MILYFTALSMIRNSFFLYSQLFFELLFESAMGLLRGINAGEIQQLQLSAFFQH